MIDVIITTYNRVDSLKRTMESFLSNTDLNLISKIIITNDNSTDGTCEYLKELESQIKKIKIVQGKERKGLVYRFNEAFLLTNADFICEFQDDILFEKNWLSVLFPYLMYKDIHFISGLDFPEHNYHKSFGKLKIKPSSRFNQLLARRDIWEKWIPFKPFYDFPTPTIKKSIKIHSKIDQQIYNFKKNDWESSGLSQKLLSLNW